MNTIITTAAVGTTALFCFLYKKQYQRSAKSPPYLGGLPFIGVLREYTANPHEFVLSCKEKYGDIFSIYLAGNKLTYVCDPVGHTQIYKDTSSYDFGEFSKMISHKVFTFPPEHYDELTELLEAQYGRFLSGEALYQLSNSFTAQLEKKAAKLIDGAFNEWYSQDSLYEFVTRWMFHAGADSFWGEGFATDLLFQQFREFDKNFPTLVGVSEAVGRFVAASSIEARQKAIEWFTTQRNLPGRAKLIEERAKEFDRIHPEARPPSDFTFFWATQGNAVPATFWVLFHLLKHPEALQAIKEEIQQVVGDKSTSELVPLLKDLVKLDSAISESLRLTSSSMSLRFVTTPTSITLSDGREYTFEKGEQIIIPSFVTHYDPEIFENPYEYKYDRSLTTRKVYKNGKLVPRPELAFGGGASYCPGRYFARNEIKTFIVYVVRNLEFEIPNDAITPKFTYDRCGFGIYQPIGKVPFRFRKLKH